MSRNPLAVAEFQVFNREGPERTLGKCDPLVQLKERGCIPLVFFWGRGEKLFSGGKSVYAGTQAHMV